MVSRLKFHWWNVVVVLTLVLCETLVDSQYYLAEEGADLLLPPAESSQQPVYLYNSDLVQSAQPLVPITEEGRAFSTGSDAVTANPGRLFAARVGRSSDSDEDDDEDDDEDNVSRPSKKKVGIMPAGRSRPVHLPPGFDDKIKKRMKMSRRTKVRPLQGDPDPIDDDDEDGRKPESRLLWPFSIEITKGAKEKGWGGPGGYGSYHEWLANTHGHGGWGPISGPWGSWGNHGPGLSHPYGWKPGDLTDEEILNSKHYKKYRKKKKKKIKKLKKKLKFKRLVQKILQKHITYLDKIAPY